MIGACLGFVIAEMTLTHAVARRWRNYSIVDVVWSGGFACLILLIALTAPTFADAPSLDLRRSLLLGMVIVWSCRLALHLGVRVGRHHPAEDVRYAQLRQEWGANVDRRMFGFFQLQGGIQLLLSIPWLPVFLHRVPARTSAELSIAEILGASLWIIALCGESLADRQLARFRANPRNAGKVCQEGLWNYSRHPNYFFEWLVWVAFAIFALGSPWGWIGFLAPALMYHFLVNVTGIPMTEALSLRSKGDAYRDYQRTTSPFIPWFKRSLPTP